MGRLIISDISLFPRGCPRRKILEALKDGEKPKKELIEASGLHSGNGYLSKILRGLRKKRYVERLGSATVAYYKITERGIKFLDKKNIEEVL